MGFWLGWTGVGLAAALALSGSDLTTDYPTNWKAVAAVLLVVPLSARVLFRRAVTVLGRHRALLVPLGLRVGMLAGIGVLANESWPVQEFSVFDRRISVLAVSVAIVHVYYAAWVTPMLIHAGRDGRCDLLGSARRAVALWPRTAILLAVGHGVPLGATWAIQRGEALDPVLVVCIYIVLSLVWNVLASGFLLVGLETPGHIGHGLLASWRIAAKRFRSVTGSVLAFMLFCGWVLMNSEPGSTVTRMTPSTSVMVNTDYVGGYVDRCVWYERALDAHGEPTLPIAVLLISLAFGFLALAVKLEVARRLRLLRPEGSTS